MPVDPIAPRVWLHNEAGRKGVPLRRSFERWIGAIPELAHRPAQVNILIAGEEAARDYNRRFRQRDYATNVLSFPWQADAADKSDLDLLGDLVICAPVVAREALQQHKPLRAHYAHLAIHGTLHLLGHDHGNDAEAERMEALERAILATLGIADPYAGSGAAS